jgi:hypothetical protein
VSAAALGKVHFEIAPAESEGSPDLEMGKPPGPGKVVDRRYRPTPPGELVEFPFPLRTGQMARLLLPSQGLHPKDADRMSAFRRTLQYEEQKQLPERTGEDEVEIAA